MNNYMSLKDHVYNYISEKINDGSLTPNEKISEQQICDELQISRTPVREALIQLAAEGYLDNLPRRGFVVKLIDEKKAKELYTIIGCLDGLAANLSLNNITENELSYMQKLVKDMYEAIDKKSYSTYYKLQVKFHDTYINRCGNEELIKLLSQLRKCFLRQSYNGTLQKNLTEVLKKTNSQHLIIIELFKKGDRIELEKYLKEVHWSLENAKFDSIY